MNKAPRLLVVAGSVALRALLLLYPPVSHDAIALLHCVPVTLSAAAASTLNGGPAFDSGTAGSAGSTVRVSVLADNPYYVCWAKGGLQSPAGALAIITLAFVVVGLPLGCLLALLRDPAERRARCSVCWRDFCGRRDNDGATAPSRRLRRQLSSRLPSFRKRPLLAVGWSSAQPQILRVNAAPTATREGGGSALATTNNPMQVSSRRHSSASKLSSASLSEGLLLLAAFLGDYRPEAWYTRFADVALAFLISTLQVR